MAAGRPLKFQDVVELQKAVTAYFAQCDPHTEEVTEWVEARKKDGTLKKDKYGLNYLIEVTHMVKTPQIPYTITGLALALRTTRDVLIDYENRDDEFSYTIKEAKHKIQDFVERQLHGPSPTGAIFNLKANYKWRDNDEVKPPAPQNPLVFINNVPVTPEDTPNSK